MISVSRELHANTILHENAVQIVTGIWFCSHKLNWKRISKHECWCWYFSDIYL